MYRYDCDNSSLNCGESKVVISVRFEGFNFLLWEVSSVLISFSNISTVERL